MIRRSLPLLLALTCLSCGGGSGDEGDGLVTMTVISVSPNTSSTVNGGDVVVVRGTNFLTAQVSSVLFAGTNAGFLEAIHVILEVLVEQDRLDAGF